ncbi:MAG: hypothetical protein IKV90_08190 [Clostridia bacterium]|nr:hypothetical protein [Clostridia bacterium]
MAKSGLKIGAYYLAAYASTQQHVKDLAQCGIDMVVNMRNDRKALDLLAQHGVSAIVSGIVPGWFGGDGSNAGTMAQTNPLEKYEAAAQAFEDHPAIIGIDAGDEPSSLDFAHYGQVIDLIGRRFSGKFAYLNIYPSYALKGSNMPEEIERQLGTPSYAEYIERYVQAVKTPYICFDYYLYSADLAGLYESMAVVSQACKTHQRDMWTVLQVNSHQPDVFISEKQLSFQANCALAFGAQAIIWACYCAGWWHNHVLDKQGNRTEQYEKLKKVNARLHALGEAYMKYRHEETCFVGSHAPEALEKTGLSALEKLSVGPVSGLHADGAALIVGIMRGKDDPKGTALYVFAADDPKGACIKRHRVKFTCKGQVRAAAGNEDVLPTNDGAGEYAFDLETCQGVLLMIDEETK